MVQNTAILFFHNTSMVEASSKNWLIKKGKKNQILAEHLIKETYNKVNKTGLPVISISSNIQIGDTFGEKLTNAIHSVYNIGFQKVIVIGSDCPKLSVSDIELANKLNQNGNIVLGPDTNGGVYLIALNKKDFNKTLFQKLPWNSKNLFEALISYSVEVNACSTYLRKRADLHENISTSSFSDFKNLLNWELLKIISSLLTPIYKMEIYFFLYFSLFILTSKGLRAPPSSIF